MAIFKPRANQKLLRYEIAAWEGLNNIVGDNLTKKGEPGFIENARSLKIGWIEKRAGHTLFGVSLNAVGNYGLYDFINDGHTLIRISKVGTIVSIYRYSEQSNSWVQLLGNGTSLSAAEFDFASAFERCFIVNGVDNNRYLQADGSNVVDSNDITGMVYNSPKARLVAFFKSQVYLGDYTNIDGTKARTGICFSSVPLGIVSLVSGDQTAPITSLTVTDTKYIKVGAANDSLDIYRGGSLIGTLTVTGKTQTTLTVSSFGTNLLSSDELWIANTRSGEKVIRWDNRATGIDARTYDSFLNISPENLVSLETIGNNLMIFTANSITIYNGSALRSLDLNIGCVSKKSFVKILGQAIFLHYTGIYSTTGGVPTLLSAKIQKIFDNADRRTLEKSCAAVDGFSYFVYIGQVTFNNSDGSVKKILNDVVVEYNLRQGNFFIHTDIPFSHFINFAKDGEVKLLFAKKGTISIAVSDSVHAQEFIGINTIIINVADTSTVTESVTVTRT